MALVIGEIKEHCLFRRWLGPSKYVIIVYGTIATMKRKWPHIGYVVPCVCMKTFGWLKGKEQNKAKHTPLLTYTATF